MSVSRREDLLTIEDKRKIDQICTQFEAEWLAGRRPLIEAFLHQVQPAAQEVLLGELLLLELDYRRSLQEELSADDYRARFPRMRDVIGASFQATLAHAPTVRFLPGTMIGRYEVRKTLGCGAFAVVYLAWDSQLEREVAVKVPHRFLLSDEKARQRFLDEARIVARLRHPRIVALYDVAELPNEGPIYLVMQYVAGDSLRKRLAAEPVAPPQACQIAAEVADAMAAAHRAGVFHRDLKPSNIVLDENGQPHVCDFGLALHVDQQRERQGEYAGTLAYMAPEQMRGEMHQLDGRADIWALGVIHYEMLTGKVPFEGRDRQELFDEILHRDPRPPRQLVSGIPLGQERVCLRCLAKQPSQRYATAGDVARELRMLGHDRRPVWPRLLLAAMVLASIIAAITLWRPARNDYRVLRVPLEATLELLVWDVERPDRQGVRLVEANTLPLRHGDQVRINVQLNQPAYVYLLWLDAQGAIWPVYPWEQNLWGRRPADELPRLSLTLPERQGDGWPMEVKQDGCESLLLLARRSPLPNEVDLQQLLANVPCSSRVTATTAMWFQNGQLLPTNRQLSCAAQRPPDFDHPLHIQDPLLDLQRRTAEILSAHFDLIRAVSFPVKGG